MMIETKIRPIRPTELPDLVKLAASDGHNLLAPTHVVEHSGKPVGCLSIGSVPMALVWMHTKDAQRTDSLRALFYIEDVLADRGSPGVVIPCADSSPFYQHMQRVGYTKLMVSTFFAKLLCVVVMVQALF